MRKLLYFGTGAAIIGIVLLLLAFYASYSIVASLQNELANNTNVNLVLEDATLEAIFLGIMAALGYALVSQGLGGIRREELLELEGTVEDAVAVRQEREKLAGFSRDVVTVPRATHKGSAPAKSPQARTGAANPDAAAIPATTAATAPSITAAVPSTKGPEAVQSQAIPSTFSWRTASVEPPKPVTESSSSSVITEPAPPTPATEAEVVDTTKSEEQTVSGKPFDESASMSQPTQTDSPPPVVWEGGPPPKLEGVEVLPEPPEHGAAPTESPEDSSAQTSTDDASTSQPSPKRGRGRPKGSKNRKSDEQS